MYQMVNGMGSMGRNAQDMAMPMGSNGCAGGNTGAWNRQTMEQSGHTGDGMSGWNNQQSASEMFAGMPGSMNGNMAGNMNSGMGNMEGGMSGNMPAGSMNAQSHTSTPGEGRMRTLDLDTGLSEDALENPTSLLEARLGSLRALLSKLVGHYIVATFLIGTRSPVSWEGFLYNVGNDYIVIFQPDMGRYVTGDMFSLKFVEFYEEKGVIPPCIGYRRRDSQNMW